MKIAKGPTSRILMGVDWTKEKISYYNHNHYKGKEEKDQPK